MHVAVVGLNHRTALVELRERLAVDRDAMRMALGLQFAADVPAPAERVILSTCNRFELYMAFDDPTHARTALLWLVAHVHGPALPNLEACLYEYQDREAARHLFRVACGLDSMILGEPQILGQVTAAYEVAREEQATGPFLSRLFQEAIRVGKRARAETEIGRAHASVGSAAVHQLQLLYPDLCDRRVLVVGAGTMARIVARYLHDLGVVQLAVINRTFHRARALAEEVGGTAHPWEALVERLAWADVIVVSTGAPSYLIHPAEVAQALARRAHRSLTIVDIGVPRNVHPDVGRMAGVTLMDIDALQSVVEEGLAVRRNAIPQVEALIEQAVEQFDRWRRSRVVAPTIAALYDHAEAIRRRELARTLKYLPSIREEERQHLEIMTRNLVDKLLQPPTRRLQVLATQGDWRLYDTVIRQLFELDG